MTSLAIHGLFGVKGFVAVVTGGSSGLGFMICKGLVKNGARVYVVALPSEPIDECVKELNQLAGDGGSAIGHACDVSSKEGIAKLAAYTAAREVRVDLLVSNAGIRRDPPIACDVLKAPLAELQASMWSSHHLDWAASFAVNTTAHYFLSVAFLPLLAAASQGLEGQGHRAGRGSIVITSSCASMHNATNVDLTSYAASKAATDHLVRLLAAKFSRFYVRVNSINPGFVPSKMNPVGAEGNMFSNLFDKMPAKRAGEADDIAGAVLYLASWAGSYIDGINLCIDGGRILLANGQEPELSDAELDGLFATLNICNVSTEDKYAYKPVLQSFMAVMNKIGTDPDYTPPSLVPEEAAETRSYSVPTAEENPMNAWSHLCNIKNATSASQLPKLLLGRSFAVKDNISVAGLPTTIGLSPQLFEGGKYQPAEIDATVVARILTAGAVVKGTSTCEGWCASPLSYTSFTGPVHNPWLHGHTSGGSSSGSASLVAAHNMKNVFPFDTSVNTHTDTIPTAEIALGSDQAGSIRIPASYCGIYGLKPTFGLVPYTGAASMSAMIDHLGPMASTLEDIAAVLETIAGYDGLDPRMSPESPLRDNVLPYLAILADFRAQNSSEVGTWKVGLLKEGFEMAGVTDAVRNTVLAAARKCFEAAGAEVVNISVPMHADGPVLWNASTRPSMATWLLQGRGSGHLTYLPPHIRPATGKVPFPDSDSGLQATSLLNKYTPAAINILLSQQVSNTRLAAGLEAKAHRKVLDLRAAYDAALEQVDVLITPCAPNVARPLPSADTSVAEMLAYAIGTTNNTAPFNATGHPAMNVPCGTSPFPERPDVQLPVGMQVIGRRFQDEKVLLAAALFERGRDSLMS
ncbi:hypothetical protein Sste5346_009856 [Sporothrix stenoceras]|uniref:Amidase domain-containing protein n=1 Tax=Sporothrix stenoceras TaxID=5173 RepID=A0ABR3YKL8_9PEZI